MFREEVFPVENSAAESSCVEFAMDEETFRAFYERTARGVWAYLARVTGDRQLADDLLQEAFYRFIRANAVYDSESHRRNSLYRIATNLARDARRRSLLRPAPAVAGHDIESTPAFDHPGAADRSTDLTRAMQHLPAKERAMLWLAYGEGASHGEIASVLGINPASLKTMLFRARKKLAGLLRGQGGRA